jgi:hypothetical protein
LLGAGATLAASLIPHWTARESATAPMIHVYVNTLVASAPRPPYDLGEMIAVNERGLAWLHFPRARVGTKALASCVTASSDEVAANVSGIGAQRWVARTTGLSARSAGHAPST